MSKEDITITVQFMFNYVITRESNEVILEKVSDLLENFIDDYDFAFGDIKPDFIVSIDRE